MSLEDYIKDLAPELQEKARTCGSIEELVAVAKEAEIPMPDEALEAIAGGQDIDVVECGKTKCPQCGSTSVTLRTEDHVSYTDFYYTCKSCGYTWMDRSYV